MGELGDVVEGRRVVVERLVPLCPDLVGGPRGVGDRIPVRRVSGRGDLAVREICDRSGGRRGERVAVRRPVETEERGAEDHLAGGDGGRVLTGGRDVVEQRRRQRGCRLRAAGEVWGVLHHEEAVDDVGQGGDVVEAARVAGGRRVRVHRHLPVRIDLVERSRHLADEVRQAGLVRAPVALEVEVDAVEVLRLDRSDQRLRQRGRGGRARGELVERLLIEVVDGQYDTDPGRMGPVDQVDEILALVPVPTGTGLVEGAIGIDPDREVGDRRQSGNVERCALAERPVRREAKDLVTGERRGGSDGRRRGSRRRRGRRQLCSVVAATEQREVGVTGFPGVRRRGRAGGPVRRAATRRRGDDDPGDRGDHDDRGDRGADQPLAPAGMPDRCSGRPDGGCAPPEQPLATVAVHLFVRSALQDGALLPLLVLCSTSVGQTTPPHDRRQPMTASARRKGRRSGDWDSSRVVSNSELQGFRCQRIAGRSRFFVAPTDDADPGPRPPRRELRDSHLTRGLRASCSSPIKSIENS